MHRDHHNWYSHRLSRDMGVNVYGHYGMPILTFSMGDENEQESIGHHLDDWGPESGHEWPYWHHQMWEYVGAHF